MREVAFLERLAETLLEGGFARALKPELQPVQVAKALTREMERSQVVAADARLVANRYLVYLHPDDLALFAGFQVSLERELAGYLRGYAARRGLRPLAPPTVRLLPAPAPARQGRVRVEASLVDLEPPPPRTSADAATYREGPPAPGSDALWGGTAEMPVVITPHPPSRERPPARLIDEAGNALDLSGEATSIGRAVDNDLVLETRGVSRHHARIVWESDRYVLLDLESTNGSFVAGQRVTRQEIPDGEEVSFAGVRFTFRLVDHHEPEPSP